MAENDFRLVPDFSGAGTHRLSIDAAWESLAEFLRSNESRTVLSLLPTFWQIEPLVHAACRSVRIPLISIDAANVPVGAAAIRALPIDTVVSAATDAEAFVQYLDQNGISLPKSWFIVHAERKADIDTALMANVAHEVQAFPGEAL